VQKDGTTSVAISGGLDVGFANVFESADQAPAPPKDARAEGQAKDARKIP
jgi:hypothetical protein